MPANKPALGACLVAAACSVSGVVGVDMGDTDSMVGSESTNADPPGTPPMGDVLLDVMEGEMDLCQAFGSQNDFAPCKLKGPVEAFEPSLQWSWEGDGQLTDSFVAPLVANLTDDNGDGDVDLCDTPDIVVLAAPPLPDNNLGLAGDSARLFILDGASGAVHQRIDYPLLPGYTPALGDVDADGVTDIVAVADEAGTDGRIVIFSADGSVISEGEARWPRKTMGAVALANVNGDAAGEVEIIVDHVVLSAGGRQLFRIEESPDPLLPIAADITGDGRLEVVWGHQAADAQGNLLFPERADFPDGYPHIGNFDGDPGPEILLTTARGIALLDSDGTILAGPDRPRYMNEQRVPEGPTTWRRPAAILDITGDGQPQILMSVREWFMAVSYVNGGFRIDWQQPVSDWTGVAASTAFDFLGDGFAEAVYADEGTLWLYDLDGRDVLSEPRSSITLQEFPVVADVDNDGSAEIVVVSNRGFSGTAAPTVRVFGEQLSGWVPARRIWNQHTYHVTNVEEDGSIPRTEVSAHRRLNTFRANVQIEGGLICKPEP